MIHDTVTAPVCLNCGAALQGPFCSHCGQRVIPAYPTLREMAGDAWREFSGYDGRFARTFRLLLWRPGALTLEVLEGRRARYVAPLRVYLAASLVYFLFAAAAPDPEIVNRPAVPGTSVTVKIGDREVELGALTPEERSEALESLARAPWWMQPIAHGLLLDPAGFRMRLLENLPRTFFVLVPVFAAIVAMFNRRRPFSQHLVFSLHFHAATFVAFAASELVTFTRHAGAAAGAEVAARLFALVYGLLAFRRVYRDPWPWIVLKGAGVLIVYLAATIVALLVTMAWVVRG
jgi:hypothetical protein